MRVLWTGDRGFIAGYCIKKMLDEGYTVVGIDNNSKYGKVSRSFDNYGKYTHIEGDVKDKDLLVKVIEDNSIDVMVVGAAMIGGISYFHSFAYDLLSENEKILTASFDAAIEMYKKGILKCIFGISSSMIYESTNKYPSKESDIFKIAPPMSTYGFQKLMVHYFCKGAYEQHGLPYKIMIPFNAVGIGEIRAKNDKEVMSGDIKLAMSHVIPDLIHKIYKKQDPLHILGKGNQIRHYTYAEDLAEGFMHILKSDRAVNGIFNISSDEGIDVLNLALKIWKIIRKDKSFNYTVDKAYTYDVQKRIPDTIKAKSLLGFRCNTKLDKVLEEIIPWYIINIDKGLL
jgi:nucleoside-diphosphate-sugar epimerase